MRENLIQVFSLENLPMELTFLREHFTNIFPEAECCEKDEREIEVCHSTTLYTILIYHKKFKEYTITNAYPYIYTSAENSEVLYGWLSAKLERCYDNFERQIHLDNEIVIGWIITY